MVIKNGKQINTMHSTVIPELDFLRGLGALAILVFHLWPKVFFFAGSRVDMFFVMSGYLITSIVVRNKKSPGFLLRFYARRILRTWPSYFILIYATFMTCQYLLKRDTTSMGFIYLTFSQNIPYYWLEHPDTVEPLLLHTWCLANEEQFYLIWPMIVIILDRPRLMLAIIWIMGNSVILRACGLHPWTIAARCDGLMLGSFIAILLSDRGWIESRLRIIRWTCVILGGLSALFVLRHYSLDIAASFRGEAFSSPLGPKESLLLFGINVFYASLITFVVSHSGCPALLPMRGRTISYIGKSSYGIYLYHWMIIFLIARHIHIGDFYNNSGLLILFTCCLIGIASWELIEKPISNLKRHFTYIKMPAENSAS